MPQMLVTGASGFVGKHLVSFLMTKGHQVAVAGRQSTAMDLLPANDAGMNDIKTWRLDLERPLDLDPAAYEGIDTVFHLAAQVHVMRPTPADNARFRLVNVVATEAIAKAAAAGGVRRFVFLSSIKVNGESSGERPFSSLDPPRAIDPYGVSKLEAESALSKVSLESGMEVVVVRPPLVYGPGVRANFLRLMRLAGTGLPLPLGAIRNSRSLVNVWNLAEFLEVAGTHPGAANKVWLVSDDEDISTPELFRRMAIAQGKRPALWRVPVPLLTLAGALSGQRGEIRRLTESLRVDVSATRSALQWRPQVSLDEGLLRTARSMEFESANH